MSVERIVIELETPGDSRSLFRLRLDNKVVGEHLTAVLTFSSAKLAESRSRQTPPTPFKKPTTCHQARSW
jgi:hypothetical protein